ncbi:hypothetical protein R6Q59_011690 [Mikania micrantha]|uniref:Phytosulfokine n=1 Tax=Mikania micrantha TaxID=192012 RepID=A0A5N6LMM8_9ASTR|nr:hypothetical protein E3N88_41537 [Mikania micrantha]
MKHSSRCGVPFIFLLSIIVFSDASARFFHIEQSENTIKVDESINAAGESSVGNPETGDWFKDVMGFDCGSGDEDCLKRRLLADAHLDYIYTQHHKH